MGTDIGGKLKKNGCGVGTVFTLMCVEGRQRRAEDITVKPVTINMYFHTDITL